MDFNKMMKSIDEKYLEVWDKFTKNPNDQNVSGFASHQPVLVTLLQKYGGKCNVLELGCGYGSSPILAGLSSYSEHYETDYDWLQKVKEFESENHSFHFVDNHEKFMWNDLIPFSKSWDIAFIDNASGESRQSNLIKLKDKCSYIVCHDTEEVYKQAASDYRWNFSMFKYHYVFKNYNTFTTVVSNYFDFTM
jgi:hypothetical protein